MAEDLMKKFNLNENEEGDLTLSKGTYALIIAPSGEVIVTTPKETDENGERAITKRTAFLTAIGARMTTDPNFMDEMLMWFDRHLDELDEEEEENKGRLN